MIRIILALLPLLLVLGCGDGDAVDQPRVTLQLNWKPEPQFGGFYAAQLNGDYARHGLEVQIVPGGAGAPTIDMVGAGTVPFAIVSADEILLARARGNDVVALFAVYQINPQGIMTRADRGFTDIGDIFQNPGTLAMERGLPYSEFLERKYGFGQLKIVPSPYGDLTLFRTDPTYSMQCFVTSEPIAARHAGLSERSFLIADAGYNPYTTVLATSRSYLDQHPERVQAMVRAVADGWDAYMEDPTPANAHMRQLNPTMDQRTFTDSAAAQAPLILTDHTREHGLGAMTARRWQQLADQLRELRLVAEPLDVTEVFIDLR
jgi:NitT/TauT family transport system substrate-binding protein